MTIALWWNLNYFFYTYTHTQSVLVPFYCINPPKTLLNELMIFLKIFLSSSTHTLPAVSNISRDIDFLFSLVLFSFVVLEALSPDWWSATFYFTISPFSMCLLIVPLLSLFFVSFPQGSKDHYNMYSSAILLLLSLFFVSFLYSMGPYQVTLLLVVILKYPYI